MLIGIIIVVLCFFGDARAKELAFPPVVHATYKTIAHQISEHQEYPSREKAYTLYYDRYYGGVRIEYKNENGVDITIIRNYKERYEARIERYNGEDLCEYSYLGIEFPNPDFPKGIHPNKDQIRNGKKYQTYSYQDYRQYIDIYVDSDLDFPMRSDEFYIDEKNHPEPVFSIVYESVDYNPIDPSIFDVLSLKERKACTRNSKGWPYHHLLGPFVKA